MNELSYCIFEVVDLSPLHFRKQAATDGTVWDLNIGVSPGFGGLIQGQIYNPAFVGVVGVPINQVTSSHVNPSGFHPFRERSNGGREQLGILGSRRFREPLGNDRKPYLRHPSSSGFGLGHPLRIQLKKRKPWIILGRGPYPIDNWLNLIMKIVSSPVVKPQVFLSLMKWWLISGRCSLWITYHISIHMI